MDSATMRKRGWSIQSDQTSHSGREKEEGQVDDGDADLLDDNEKKSLLNSFPVQAVHAEEQPNDVNDQPPPAKRQKTGDAALLDDGLTHHREEPTATTLHDDKEEMVEVAKTKLSKWAARLFDPDRPRGLVQAPQTIPLNDEFLTAFGKRERDFDDKLGRKIEIDPEIVDDGNDSSNDVLGEDNAMANHSSDAKKKSSVEGRKVKILNLAYTTTQPTLEAACQKFGPVENANLLMDKERANLNAGRAYVTFETTESANACVDGLQTLDGRPMRVSIAPMETKRAGKRSMAGSTARYWVKDISTKCFRCGHVGHMSLDCPNAAILNPCPLCGGTDHDMRACPKSRVCFRCGVPGHINRECSYRQNLPKRVVCGICFQSGHHRCSCRRRPTDAPSNDAKCFVCHKDGHFMCREMKWFFGLEGVSCFNCGRNGHHGYDCDRPGVDLCARDDGLADREIERATAMSLADEVEQQMGMSRNRGRDRGYDGDRSRAKSQPPRQFRSSNNNNGGSRRSSGNNGGSRRSSGGGAQRNEQRRSSKGSQGSRGYDTSKRHDSKRRR